MVIIADSACPDNSNFDFSGMWFWHDEDLK